MQLEPIIQALRQRCNTVFGSNVAGAAEFKLLEERVALPVPFAFVIPLDDNPGESMSSNSVRQMLQDSFAVVVAISNLPDEKGQAGVLSVNAIRASLWSALLGWRPADRYDGITYQGGQLLHLDRARLWYQFDFAAGMEIEPSDGWQETELAALPHFDGGTVKLDAIDPHDPNVVQTSVPDGRYEGGFVYPKSGNLPS